MAALPMDIIHNEILPKLPTKSLLRMKCVCKSFRMQITSSKFINHYLQTSLTSINNRFLIYRFGKGSNELYCIHLDSADTSPTQLRLPSFDVPVPKCSKTQILGCCNGLLLFKKSRNSIYKCYDYLFLLNPSTGMGTECTPLDNFLHYNKLATYGFGFDSRYYDYKIVRILEYNNDRDGNEDSDDGNDMVDAVGYVKGREVKVYSMRSNSWRLVEDKRHPKDYIKCNGICVTIDNYLIHWLIYEGNYNYRIACFNIQDEVWGNDIPLPDDIGENQISKPIELGVVDRCLCLVTRGACLWVMKDYGVKESWIMLLHLSDYTATHPLQIGVIKNGKSRYSDIWIRKEWESKVLLCEVMATTSEGNNKLVVRRADKSHLEAYLCFGSLVQIPQGKQMAKKP